ncbi:hypothetical protein [Flagellimonas profundi]|uniref:Permease n=1 Tax=Flagellimonas profundi TaxID=2915620 RepID=A0ABS3FL02_9FLAO|nr:hypothetical protein [Allomuricauda profundi]MBO0343166.1 hypothetical protein [Allomuricauda profundi]
MEFNIALHTIFYVSIFIIPGFLLRRFYFTGEFNKEFSQGNLMERFIWTIFSSIMVLLASSFFFYLLRVISGKKLLSAISYSTIKEIFDLLSNNEIPKSSKFFLVYKDFLILILGVYIAAILIGIVFRKAALSNFLRSLFPVLKYKNYWYYFIRGKVKLAPKESGMVYWYTDADILVDQNGKAKMYSGKITDYFINSETNELESIFLEDTNRYKFDDNGNYQLVPIPGHTLCIPFNRMLNMNLTYVNREKNQSWKRNVVWWLIEISYYGLVFILVSLFFLEDFPFIKLNSILDKIGFSINTWVLLSIFKAIFQNIVFPIESSKRKVTLTANIIGVIVSSIQYLWIFDIYGFFSVLGLTAIVFFILVFKFVNVEKKEENSKDSLK